MAASFEQLLELLDGRTGVALTGAGISTDSGIPDYRGPGSPRSTPMTISEFCSGAAAQQRYWARSHIGYARMTRAMPNEGHRAMADLERAGVIIGVVTQNVDDLHRAAGSRTVIDLHGRIAEVICLDCGARTPRAQLQNRLTELNPGFIDHIGTAVQTAPDGDAVLADVAGFRIAGCNDCGGRLKPDVVFFGENVPRERVEAAFEMVDAAEFLLVAGSSLTVMSGLRFVRRARLRLDIPVVIINRGPTRGDELATVRIDAGCSETLRALADSTARRRVPTCGYAHNREEMGRETTVMRITAKSSEPEAVQIPISRGTSRTDSSQTASPVGN